MPRDITGQFAFLATIVLLAIATIAGARAADTAFDPATFRLTSELLDRVEAVNAEAEKLPASKSEDQGEGDDDEDEDEESVESMVRKLDADPRVRAILARHDLTSTQYAVAMLTALEAGMVLAVEKATGRPYAESLTPTQRANVALLRSRQQGRK